MNAVAKPSCWGSGTTSQRPATNDPPVVNGEPDSVLPNVMPLAEEVVVVLVLDPNLAAAVGEFARQRGVAPDVLALDVLRERFLPPAAPPQPRDEWERRLLGLARECGVSLPDAALGREALYE